jgi:hypothetical protein
MELLLFDTMVPPVTFHVYVFPVTNGDEYTMVCKAQTVSGPVIWGAGMASTVAVTEVLESHPRLLLSVTAIVAVPGMVHWMVTEVPFEGPEMAAPVTTQE